MARDEEGQWTKLVDDSGEGSEANDQEDRENVLTNLIRYGEQPYQELPPEYPAMATRPMYSSLKFDEIRLLVLHPGGRCAGIQCHLVCVPLSLKPKYEALSYEWTDQPAIENIRLGHEVVLVRKNLWNALVRLRRNHEFRVLWIDALCVDQSNLLERSQQVRLMRNIYQQAVLVCVWLGAERPDLAAKTFRFIDDHSNLRLTDTHAYTRRRNDHWRYLMALCDLSYWNRLWIIQEVVLAHTIDLYWADSVVSWTKLSLVFRDFGIEGRQAVVRKHALSRNPGLSQQLSNCIPGRLDRQRQTDAQTCDASIFSLFRKYSRAQCSDKRDRIFGLLSFACECCIEAISADYTLSPPQLSLRVIEHQTQFHQQKSLLRNPRLARLIFGNIIKMQHLLGYWSGVFSAGRCSGPDSSWNNSSSDTSNLDDRQFEVLGTDGYTSYYHLKRGAQAKDVTLQAKLGCISISASYLSRLLLFTLKDTSGPWIFFKDEDMQSIFDGPFRDVVFMLYARCTSIDWDKSTRSHQSVTSQNRRMHQTGRLCSNKEGEIGIMTRH